MKCISKQSSNWQSNSIEATQIDNSNLGLQPCSNSHTWQNNEVEKRKTKNAAAAIWNLTWEYGVNATKEDGEGQKKRKTRHSEGDFLLVGEQIPDFVAKNQTNNKKEEAYWNWCAHQHFDWKLHGSPISSPQLIRNTHAVVYMYMTKIYCFSTRL